MKQVYLNDKLKENHSILYLEDREILYVYKDKLFQQIENEDFQKYINGKFDIKYINFMDNILNKSYDYSFNKVKSK